MSVSGVASALSMVERTVHATHALDTDTPDPEFELGFSTFLRSQYCDEQLIGRNHVLVIELMGTSVMRKVVAERNGAL